MHDPETCAYTYLQNISQELRAQSPLLWTNQGPSIISSFSTNYGVTVSVIDAFGSLDTSMSTTNTVINIKNIMGYGDFRSNAMGESFFSSGIRTRVPYPSYIYAFITWNSVGEMYYVAIVKSKVSGPFFC